MPERNKNRAPYTLVKMLRLIPRSSLPIGVAWNKCEEAADRIEELEAALQSIASNTCCDKCQEAALVARAALEGEWDGST